MILPVYVKKLNPAIGRGLFYRLFSGLSEDEKCAQNDQKQNDTGGNACLIDEAIIPHKPT